MSNLHLYRHLQDVLGPYTYEEHICIYTALLLSLTNFLTYEKLALDDLSTPVTPHMISRGNL